MTRRRISRPPTTTPRPRRPQSPRGAGTAGDRGKEKPTWGWKGHATLRKGWRNTRTPAVPATLDILPHEYFAAAALMGLIASQVDEPDQHWCCDWSFRMGRRMANEARKRRKA